jgi:hypothetical protein
LSGCAVQHESNPKSFTFLVEPEGASPIVVMVEKLYIRGQVDSHRPPQESLLDARVFMSEGKPFTVDVPEETGLAVGLLWYYEFSDDRVTLFSPGYALLSIYPREYGNMAVMGWRSDRNRPFEGASNSMPAYGRYDKTSAHIDLRVGLRTLRTEGRYVLPSPNLLNVPPDPLCNVDALTLGDQLRMLSIALDKMKANSIDAKTRAVMWEAIDKEFTALESAGFADLLPARDSELMLHLRRDLGKE